VEKYGEDDVSVVDDESQRRMKQLSSGQMEKLYGKGYRLLQKAGFDPTEDTQKPPPIKVVVRKPREGLQDDDLSGRKVLGEVPEHRHQQGGPESDTIDVVEYLDFFSQIKLFLESQGGSAPLYRVFSSVIKPRIPSSTVSIFQLVVDLKGAKHGFKISNGEIILIQPPSTSSIFLSQNIPCICAPPHAHYPVTFNRVIDWAAHVFERFDLNHEEYEQKLMTISENRDIRIFHCLACKRPFLDLVRLVKHCRAMGDTDHNMFGKIVVGTLLGPNDYVGHDKLFLTSLETGDEDFPWKNFSGLANDVFDDIPFEEPSTPIDLSDDDDDDVIEVIIADDDESAHDMHGVINLEE